MSNLNQIDWFDPFEVEGYPYQPVPLLVSSLQDSVTWQGFRVESQPAVAQTVFDVFRNLASCTSDLH